MTHYVIISADCHAGPDSPAYREFLDPAYRLDFDDELSDREGLLERHAIHRRRRVPRGVVRYGGGKREPPRDRASRWLGRGHVGTRSSTTTGYVARWCSRDPTRSLGRWAHRSARASTPLPRAAQPTCSQAPGPSTGGRRKLCSESPERRRGLIVAPILGDIDGAITEIRRAHGEGLTGGVIIPPRWTGYDSYTSHDYDPVWSVCEELSLPVHCHSGPAPREDYGEDRGWMSVYGYETIFFTARPLWFMLLTGVFERFPRLKMAVTEAGCFWVTDMLWRMDMMATREHGMRKLVDPRGVLTMLPSEYFDRNCAIGASNTPPTRARPPLRDRGQQHHVGERLPAPRGDLAIHAGIPEGPLLGRPPRRDGKDPRAQPSRVLRLRPSQAAAHRRTDRARRPRNWVRPIPACSRNGSRTGRPDARG